MYDYIAETSEATEVAGTLYRVRVEYDQDGTGNPRDEYDTHAGVLVVYARHYTLPCEEGPASRSAAQLAEYLDEYRQYGQGYGHSFRVLSRWLRMFHGATVVLPVYASGGDDRLTTGGLDDDGDAAIGVVYDTPDARRVGWGDEVPSVEVIASALAGEVADYAAWSRGEMTVWTVESYTLAEDEGPDDADSEGWDYVESCGGYYSVEDAMAEGRMEGLDPIVAQARERVAVQAADLADAEAEIDEMRLAEIGGAV